MAAFLFLPSSFGMRKNQAVGRDEMKKWQQQFEVRMRPLRV
jgi:hypothetical protein